MSLIHVPSKEAKLQVVTTFFFNERWQYTHQQTRSHMFVGGALPLPYAAVETAVATVRRILNPFLQPSPATPRGGPGGEKVSIPRKVA